MALSGFKKQFNKANQLLSEKVGGAKGTELTPDFVALEKLIQAYEKMLDDVLTKTQDYIQPNRGFRLGLSTSSGSAASSRNTDGGSGTGSDNTSTIEGKLAQSFHKHGTQIGQDSAIGPALLSVSETFFEMADERKSLEMACRQNFIEPLSSLQNNELKQISYHLKKVSSRRLDFDYKKRKGTPAEVEDAESKFSSSFDEAKQAMENFVESDGDHVQALLSFVSANKAFHTRAADMLNRLENKLSTNKRLSTAGARKKSSNASVPSFSGGSVFDEPTWCEPSSSAPAAASAAASKPNFSMKKKHDDLGQKKTPTCRVLFDFVAENEGELNLKEGETVKLIEQVDENWYFGEIRGQQGHFPLSYVEVLVPLSK